MGLYSRYILPHLINCACGTRPIEKERAKIVPRAAGTVLELGFGSGRNLAHYDTSKVQKIYALEPEAGMLALARKAAAGAGVPIEILPEKAEDLSLPPGSVDCVLITYTLCTIPDGHAALHAARRALKPGGRLLFCEHGLAPDAEIARSQRRIEALWSKIAGGCHLTRDVPALLASGGFRVEDLTGWYLPKTPRFAGYTYRGEAVAA
jgi:ubiquinone/menaquinone biosynthesis C-methylase UbiE